MATAEELLAQHAAQGLKVRGLKEAHGAKHPEVAAALTDLMAIKAAYKVCHGLVDVTNCLSLSSRGTRAEPGAHGGGRARWR